MSPTERPRIAGVILAAGASRRLGRPKQTLRLGQQTLLDIAIDQIHELVDVTYVVVGARAPEIMQAVQHRDIHFIDNPQWNEGMASSIRAALRQVGAGSEAMVFAACDQPLVRKSHYATLLDAWREAPDSRVATDYGNGVTGIPAVFPASDFDRLHKLAGDRGARALLTDALLVANPSAAMDIDTEQDFTALQQLPAERGGEDFERQDQQRKDDE